MRVKFFICLHICMQYCINYWITAVAFCDEKRKEKANVRDVMR